MSFNLSSGTLDTMAGIFAPAKKYRPGSGGGSATQPTPRGAILGVAVASMFPKSEATTSGYRPAFRTKQAFGGGTQGAASRRAISAMDRTARGTPEVMVRITGRQQGAGHVLANFAYISRLGHGTEKELALYTSDGEVIRDGREMQELAQDWHEWEMGDDARRKGATSLSMILSMPSGTDPERLKAAALDFAREEFANRAWVASLHVDRDHPHVHVTFARRDHDGRRFHPDRDDLFRFRQRFAQKLRDRGIEANATPARARGIDPKHEHIAARKVRLKGQVPRLDKSRATREAWVRASGKPDPVRKLLAERHRTVRQAYERSIAELRTSSAVVNQTVANSLQRFVDGLTEPEPNSLQSARMRLADRDRPRGGTAPATIAGKDPVAAALARSRAMRDSVETRRAVDRAVADPASVDARVVPTPRPSEPPRRDQPIDQPPSSRAPDKIDEVVRQTLDRERERLLRDRDRDLNPGRGGPGR